MNVVCCTKSEVLLTEYSTHSHDKYEIILNLTGECTTIINGKTYNIEANNILIIPPGAEHEAFSNTYFSDFYIQAKNMNFHNVHITNDNDGIILSLMNMLYTVILEKEFNYKQIADNLLDTICNYLVKYIDVKYKYNFVGELKNVIIDNFTNPQFDLADAIKKTGYNKDYLRRCFEEDIGKTPLEYITNLRINMAKMLLVQNDFINIKNVSERCGYSDNLYFSTVFKKHTGISPREYRQKHME